MAGDDDAPAPRPDRPPELRASDADRERTADRLRHAAGEGRLDVHELDERLDLAYAARTGSELAALTADVVPAGGRATTVPRPSSVPQVRRGDGDAHWILSIMGGATRAGRWRLGRSTTCLNVMGGSELDLSQVELDDETVSLHVVSFWGGAEINVPDGLNVEISEVSIMGANDVELGDGEPNPGGPTLRLNLISLMGGTTVYRGRKRSARQRRRERKELRRAERLGQPGDVGSRPRSGPPAR